MKEFIFPFIILFLITNSCSWHKKTMIEFENKEDLTEKFEIENDKFSKFQEKPLEELPRPVQIPEQPQPIQKKTSAVVPYKEGENPKSPYLNRVYPENYPKAFKKFDKNSQKVWSKFKPRVFIGETIIMDVKYLGIVAGQISIKSLPKVNIAGLKSYHFLAKVKSAPFYRYVYELDDYVEVFVDQESFFPIKYSLIQREHKQNIDDLQVFDRGEYKTYFWYKKVKKGKTKKEKKEAFIPYYIQDSFSILYFVRGLPLTKGAKYEIPVATRTKVWILKMEVMGKEKINVMGKDVWAHKIQAVTHFPGVLAREKNTKKREDGVLFWYSADKIRKLLKFKAKVKIGSIEGILTHYTRE